MRSDWNQPGLLEEESFLIRNDCELAYPVVSGVPILLIPERVERESVAKPALVDSPKYSEVYEEMQHYNHVAATQSVGVVESESYHVLEPLLKAGRKHALTFAHPRSLWIDAPYDCVSQSDAYRHLAPLTGK